MAARVADGRTERATLRQRVYVDIHQIVPHFHPFDSHRPGHRLAQKIRKFLYKIDAQPDQVQRCKRSARVRVIIPVAINHDRVREHARGRVSISRAATFLRVMRIPFHNTWNYHCRACTHTVWPGPG